MVSPFVAVSCHVWPVIVNVAVVVAFPAALFRLFSAVVSSLAFISAGSPVVIGSAGVYRPSV